MGALSPDGLVKVTPLENLCVRSLTRWVNESDSTRTFCGSSHHADGLVSITPLENICGRSLTRWVGECDATREFMWALFHQMGW